MEGTFWGQLLMALPGEPLFPLREERVALCGQRVELALHLLQVRLARLLLLLALALLFDGSLRLRRSGGSRDLRVVRLGPRPELCEDRGLAFLPGWLVGWLRLVGCVCWRVTRPPANAVSCGFGLSIIEFPKSSIEHYTVVRGPSTEGKGTPRTTRQTHDEL